MPKIRTLWFQPALAPYNVDLFNRLCRDLDFHVVFLNDHISYHPQLNQQRLMNLLECDFTCLGGGITVAGRDLRMGIPKIISSFQPQVVVTTEFSFATLLTLFHKKFITKNNFGHTILTTETPQILAERRGIRSLLSRKCSHLADSLMVYTEAAKKAYIDRGLSAGKIFVCANHQNEDIFIGNLRDAGSLIHAHIRNHCLAGKKIILSVGRFVDIKGTDRVICAFAKIAFKQKDALLVLIGDGPEKESLQKLAARENISRQVLFIGHLQGRELLVWYLLSSLLILASHKETYGAVVNEALLAGVPVLCSSYAGANVLIEEGKNGHVFHPYDVESISNLMHKLLINAPTADLTGASFRKNLMPITFEQSTASFVEAVKYAASIKTKSIK